MFKNITIIVMAFIISYSYTQDVTTKQMFNAVKEKAAEYTVQIQTPIKIAEK